MLRALKVRPEAFPTGSPMPVSVGFLQYLGVKSDSLTGETRIVTSMTDYVLPR